jgi:hypothetical protein
MSNDRDDKWQMPKPVFRSSPGALPKSLEKTISGYNMPTIDMADDHDDEGDILSVMDSPADGNTAGGSAVVAAEPDAEPLEIAEPETAQIAPEAVAEPLTSAPTDQVRVTAAPAMAERKGGAGSFFVIFLLIAALAAGVIYAIYYYLTARSGSNGPF